MANKTAFSNFLFRQLLDKVSSTYTYLLADVATGEAAIIDSVLEQVDRDIEYIDELQLKLKYCISTHVHADHITGNSKLKSLVGLGSNGIQKPQSVVSRTSGAKADIYVDETAVLHLGQSVKLNFLLTPGHTNGCMAIVEHQRKLLFTGDTLLIRGCGRTDFQDGSAMKLYQSVHSKLFTLSPDYAVYPAHDYKGRTVSTIGEELKFNLRLTKTQEQFVEIMENLNLDKPKMIGK